MAVTEIALVLELLGVMEAVDVEEFVVEVVVAETVEAFRGHRQQSKGGRAKQ